MARVLAAPTLVITRIAGQDVSASPDVTVSPPPPWTVEGTVQHGAGKPVIAMWYMIDGNFPGPITPPAGALDATVTAPVAFSFVLGPADISANVDYHLLVIAQNADGPTSPPQARTIHGSGFPETGGTGTGTGGGGGPGPTPVPPVLS